MPRLWTGRPLLMETEPIEILRARARLSLARMYVTDLENKANFGNMVDGRGAGFNCSKPRWIELVLKICAEALPFIPDATAIVLGRLKAACPEVIIPGEEPTNDSEVSERKP